MGLGNEPDPLKASDAATFTEFSGREASPPAFAWRSAPSWAPTPCLPKHGDMFGDPLNGWLPFCAPFNTKSGMEKLPSDPDLSLAVE